MDHTLSRLLTTCALVVVAGVLSVTACTRTTDRVVEPVGGADAAAPSTPEVTDSGAAPIGPIAHPIEPIEPAEDFRLVRAPEFGLARETQVVGFEPNRQNGHGGFFAAGNGGGGGSDLRPVACAAFGCGGSSYY
jgi:hypothetical protein